MNRCNKWRAVALLAILTPLAGFNWASNDDEAKRKAETAVVLINHLNWVVSRVEQNKDNAAVVEEEYENLTDNNINLATVEDEEAAHEIVALMSVFTDIRKVIMDMDTLQECVELQRKAAIYKAIPNPGAVLSPNPYLIALRLAECAATSYMNYQSAKSEIMIGYKKEKLEIDKHRLSALNAINEELFWRQWQMVQKHGLDDAWRTARSDCRELVSLLSVSEGGDDSKTLIYSYLKRQEERFAYLPIYWYYRALYAMTSEGLYEPSSANREDALRACDQFDRRHKKILRKDRIRASVSMMYLGAKKGQVAEEDRQRHLQLILDNAKTHDWDLAYFVADQLAKDNPDRAIVILQGMVDNLEAFHMKYEMSNHRFDVASMKELEPKEKRGSDEKEYRTAGFPTYGLFLCRSRLISLIREKSPEDAIARMRKLLEEGGENNKNVSLLEKLVYAGKLGELPSNLLCEIEKVSVVKNGDDEFRIGRMSPWMVSRCEKVRATVKVLDAAKKGVELDCSPDRKLLSGSRYDDRQNTLGDVICHLPGLRDRKIDKIELSLNYGDAKVSEEDGCVIRFVFIKPFATKTNSCASEVWYGGRRIK